MQQGLLPLFPLSVVLFPGGELPLHIFEERYKEMIDEVLKEGSEFGVILASEKGIVNTGCTATIDRTLRQYPDGRLDILARGRRRFEVLLLNEERSFLRGAVDFFDDETSEPAPADLQKRAVDGYNQMRALASESPLEEKALQDAQLSFRLAEVVPDPGLRQVLLATRSESGRLRQLAEFFPAYLLRQKQVQRVKALAPRNGHGRGLHEEPHE